MKVSERIMNAEDVGTILLQREIAVSRRSTLVMVVLSIAKGTVGLLSGSAALLASPTRYRRNPLTTPSFPVNCDGTTEYPKREILAQANYYTDLLRFTVHLSGVR
jgi:hypothetical protein